jgi:hypothetical protein
LKFVKLRAQLPDFSFVVFRGLLRALSGTIDFDQPARFVRRMALIESGSLCLVSGGGRFEFAAKFARIGLGCIVAHSQALVLRLSGCKTRLEPFRPLISRLQLRARERHALLERGGACGRGLREIGEFRFAQGDLRLALGEGGFSQVYFLAQGGVSGIERGVPEALQRPRDLLGKLGEFAPGDIPKSRP